MLDEQAGPELFAEWAVKVKRDVSAKVLTIFLKVIIKLFYFDTWMPYGTGQIFISLSIG